MAEHAASVAEDALANNPKSGYKTMDRAERYMRDSIQRYRSDRAKREYMAALRVAMLVNMERHRQHCKEQPCRREKGYIDLKAALLDELDALSPAGVYMDQLTLAQIAALERIKSEILDAIHDGFSRALEADGVLLGAMEEGFEELWQDRSPKSSNWQGMLVRYLQRKVTDKLVGASVIDPLVTDLERTFGISAS